MPRKKVEEPVVEQTTQGEAVEGADKVVEEEVAGQEVPEEVAEKDVGAKKPSKKKVKVVEAEKEEESVMQEAEEVVEDDKGTTTEKMVKPEEKAERQPTPGAENYEDKTLKCKDCGADFVWTAGQQAFYAEKGFDSAPLRCENCRKLKRQRYRSQRKLYPIICSNCGKPDNVPFQPQPGQEVLCWECFKSGKTGQSTRE